MSMFQRACFGWFLTLALGVWTGAATAQDLSYRYVSLEGIAVPPGFEFFNPRGIDGARRVYGYLYVRSDQSLIPYIAVYDKGEFRVLGGPGLIYAINESGTVGGSLIDVETSREKAALFRDGKIEILPTFAGEYTSFVTSVSDNGIALVVSYDQEGGLKRVVHPRRGRPLQVPISGRYFDINNHGEISGTDFIEGVGWRGFRFDPKTGNKTILGPTSTDPHTYAVGINNHGDIVGYSFVFSGLERIGTWDRGANFDVHFTEGTPEYPTISNWLLINDDNLIVVTSSRQGISYLVPRPGVRLDLTSLVVNPPSTPGAFQFIRAINKRGDLFGRGTVGTYMLLREDPVE